MTQALGPLAPLAPLLYTLILVSLGIGLPIIVVLTIRFLWSGHLSLGRSRELDKLVWQLHRIASTLEQQNVQAFPVDQTAAQRSGAPVAAQSVAPVTPAPLAQTPAAQTPTPSATAAQAPTTASPATRPPAVPTAPGPDEHPRAGVNSMFGL